MEDVQDVEQKGVEETTAPNEGQDCVNEVGREDEVPNDGASSEDAPSEDGEAQDVFPREYVEKLRRENAGYRDRAKRVEELEQRLHAALVTADGRLADPTDLPFNAEHLEDAESLNAAITELISAKPHLKARKFRGDIGMGRRGNSAPPADLIGVMRGMI